MRAPKLVLGTAGSVLALVLFLGWMVVPIKTLSERDAACRCADDVHRRAVSGWQQNDAKTRRERCASGEMALPGGAPSRTIHAH